jgi:hypothetical protein
MSDEKVKRTGILPSDIDPAGNVTLWDHGPAPFEPVPHETDEVKAAREQKHAAEVAAWHDANGDGPVGIAMHSSDAAHALMIDPDRYALEPDDLDESEIQARMDEMREKRELAARSPQDAIDRRVAIAAIISDRVNAKSVAELDKPGPEHTGATGPAWYPESPPATTDAATAARLAAEQKERERIAAESKAETLKEQTP